MASAISRLDGAAPHSKSLVSIVLRYALAVAAVAASLILTLMIRHSTDSPTFFSFYMAIFVSIWFGGRGPGWLALVLASLLIHYFFFGSPTSMALLRAEAPTLVAFVLCAVAADVLSMQRWWAENALRAAGQQLEFTVQERTAELRRTNEELLVEIAERERVEQALYVSEERWRRLFESSAAGMLLVNMDGRYIAANAAFLRMLGYTEAELKERTAVDITHVDERAVTKEVIADFAGGVRQEYHVEKRYLKKDGTPVWVNVTTAYVPASEPIPPLMQSVVIDIDDRKRAEAALRASEARWRGIFTTSSVGIATAASRRILSANPAFQRMVGYSEAELREMGPIDLTYQDDRPAAGRLFDEIVEGRRKTYQVEKRYRRKDGEAVWVSVNASHVPASETTPAFFTAVVVDITDRKRAEDALRASEERWRTVFETSSVGIATSDANRRISTANLAFQRMVGYSEAELQALEWRDLTHQDDHAVTDALISDLEESRRKAYQLEKRYRRKDGEVIWVGVNASYVPATETAPAFFPSIIVDITERKRAELERRRLASVVEQASDFMAIADLDGTPIYVNEAGLKMVGLDGMEQAKGRRGTHYLFREDRPFVTKVIWPAVMEKGSWSGEFRARHFKTGQPIPVLFDAFRIDDPETGRATNTGYVCRDITERKRAEQTLRTSEERWRTVFETSMVGITTSDDSRRYNSANRAFQQMVGYTEAEIRNLTPLDLTHEDDRPLSSKLIDELLAGHRQDYQIEKRYRRKDGEAIWVDVYCSRVPGTDSVPTFYQAIVIDITDRKRAEMALRASEARWRTLFETTSVGIATTDLDRRTTSANSAFQRMVGYTEDELRTFRFAVDLTHEDDLALTAHIVADFLEGRRQSYQIEKRYRRKGGEIIWVSVNASRVPGTDAVPGFYQAMVVDITDRKRAEDALQRAQAELARVSRVTTMGEFAASIAHEINQPLAAIVASGNACQRWLESGQNVNRAKESLNRIVSDANRASEVIKRIRALTRNRAAEHVHVDMNDVIDEVLTFTQSELQARLVTVRKELQADAPAVMGDRVQLQQVLLNLLMNAIEAMAPITDRRRELVITSHPDDHSNVVVTVQDSGTGLDPNDAERIFNAFFTTKADGMGMGLSISTSIIEAHGGRLWASPAIPHGTAFHFSVPAASGGPG